MKSPREMLYRCSFRLIYYRYRSTLFLFLFGLTAFDYFFKSLAATCGTYELLTDSLPSAAPYLSFFNS